QQKGDTSPVQRFSQEDQILDLCLVGGQAGFQPGDLSPPGNDDGVERGPTAVARYVLGHRKHRLTNSLWSRENLTCRGSAQKWEPGRHSLCFYGAGATTPLARQPI